MKRLLLAAALACVGQSVSAQATPITDDTFPITITYDGYSFNETLTLDVLIPLPMLYTGGSIIIAPANDPTDTASWDGGHDTLTFTDGAVIDAFVMQAFWGWSVPVLDLVQPDPPPATPAPEPSTLALLGSGLVGLYFVCRKRTA